MSYFYDQYLATGEVVGFDLATRAGLGRALQLADRNEALRQGIGMLPGKVFSVAVNGKTINVVVVEPEPGKMYLTAWYTKQCWGLIKGSYQETVEVIRVKDNYRVYNVQ